MGALASRGHVPIPPDLLKGTWSNRLEDRRQTLLRCAEPLWKQTQEVFLVSHSYEGIVSVVATLWNSIGEHAKRGCFGSFHQIVSSSACLPSPSEIDQFVRPWYYLWNEQSEFRVHSSTSVSPSNFRKSYPLEQFLSSPYRRVVPQSTPIKAPDEVALPISRIRNVTGQMLRTYLPFSNHKTNNSTWFTSQFIQHITTGVHHCPKKLSRLP